MHRDGGTCASPVGSCRIASLRLSRVDLAAVNARSETIGAAAADAIQTAGRDGLDAAAVTGPRTVDIVFVQGREPSDISARDVDGPEVGRYAVGLGMLRQETGQQSREE